MSKAFIEAREDEDRYLKSRGVELDNKGEPDEEMVVRKLVELGGDVME